MREFKSIQFQSTHPKRDETGGNNEVKKTIEFQSTHPKRDETIMTTTFTEKDIISIHSSQTG